MNVQTTTALSSTHCQFVLTVLQTKNHKLWNF